MNVAFNETIDIAITHKDEVYSRVTRGLVDGREVGDTWLSMPLDTAIELYAQLDQVIEEAKFKLNAKIESAK
jgi:hypothetical protein